jgi:orotidine-5'-phosphate decarboxylase
MPKLIISLDKLKKEELKNIIEEISEKVPERQNEILYKFNDMIALIGFQGIYELVKDLDISLMLDPKWHDIPQTLHNYIEQLHIS